MSALADFGLRFLGAELAGQEIFSIRVTGPGLPGEQRQLVQDPFGEHIERMDRAFVLELADAITEDAPAGEVVLLEEPANGLERLAYESDRIELFGHVVFHPFEPAIVSWALLGVPERRAYLLLSSHRSPTQRDERVHALLPESAEAGLQTGAILEHLLADDLAQAHGLAGGTPMDVVRLAPDSPLEPRVAASWYQALAAKRARDAGELEAQLADFAQHPGDPWTRAQLGLERGMRAVQAQLAAGRAGASRRTIEPELLARWWNTVSSDAHAARELVALPGAWAAALRLLRGDASDPEPPAGEGEATH
jgi:hypothetical protein